MKEELRRTLVIQEVPENIDPRLRIIHSNKYIIYHKWKYEWT